MITGCLKESGPPSSDSEDVEVDDRNLEIPKVGEVYIAINMCRRYSSAKSCSEKALKTLVSLQNQMYALNARKVE